MTADLRQYLLGGPRPRPSEAHLLARVGRVGRPGREGESLDEAGPPGVANWRPSTGWLEGLRPIASCICCVRVHVRACTYDVCVRVHMHVLSYLPLGVHSEEDDSSLDSKIASVDGDCAALAPSASASPLCGGCTDTSGSDGEMRPPCIHATGQ